VIRIFKENSINTFAIIGCGRISSRHVEALLENRDSSILLATCDTKLDRAEARAAQYMKAIPEAIVSTFTDYHDMLAACKPDVVSIATESGYHHQITIDCLKTGTHVIVEKPMALSTTDADAMIEAAEQVGRKLAVCFQNRFNLPVRKLREACDNGRFGRILHGMVQVRWNRDQRYYAEAPWRGTWSLDGGTLMNQCTHGIDLLQWILGEDAFRVHAQIRRFMRPIEAEDFGAALVEFASGAIGIIEGTACTFPTNLNETLSVFGEKGSVVIGGIAVNRLETWRFADSDTVGDDEDSMVNASKHAPLSVYGDGHGALFKDFIEAIVQDREPLVSGRSGKRAMELVLAIYKSQKIGQPVELPCHFSTSAMAGMFEELPNHRKR
jgi:predicted dehydrogenase